MKNKSFSFVVIILLLLFFSLDLKGANDNVYVIPIKGEINRATFKFVEKSMKDINPDNTNAIIFEIDTYGGSIEAAINIKNLIIASPVPTISYINKKAISAGSLISIASEKVVMSTTATIGSAETNPDSEKVLSMWRGVLRDTAQLRGRNESIMEAMADKDIEIEGIVKKDKLLNLTSSEALKYGISDATSDSFEAILKEFNIDSDNVIIIGESLQVKLSKHIENPYVASFLLTLGFVGLVVEVFVPGFGLGATMSIVGFGLYFGGNILAGNSDWTSLILFMIGIVLAAVAVVVPGLGLPEIGSVTFVIAGVILAVDSISTALFTLSIAIILTTIISVILIKLGFTSKLLNKVVLKSKHSNEQGFLSTDTMEHYLNKEGITSTELRPTGFIVIEGKRVDALSDGEFISKGIKVKVVRIEGSNIFVRRI